uniref:Uncharacterized protein n=1 Tax=Aegilops tauschii subsp. strangulata TaxID=200361 RepID=A0A453JZH7_AEGTS
MPVMYILVVLARQRIIKLVDGNREFLTIDKAIGENGFEIRLVTTTIWMSRGMIFTMKHKVSQTFLIMSRYI